MTHPRPPKPVVRRAPVSARTAVIVLAVTALVAVVAGTWAVAYFTVPKTKTVARSGGPVIDDAAAVAAATSLINAVFALPASPTSDNVAQFKTATCDDYRHKNVDLLQQRLDQVRSTGESTTAVVTAIGVGPHAPTFPTAQVLAVVESAHGQSKQVYRVTYTMSKEDGRVCVSAAEFQQ